MPSEALFATLIAVLDGLAIAVFAVTGSLVASRKNMDIFGFILLGTLTGIGGGTVRDVLLGSLPVFWVKEPISLIIPVVVSCAVFFLAHIPESRYRLLLWFDAVGLALFAVVGADRAMAVGVEPLIAVFMGAITAVFGGLLRDVLGGESPVILRRDIYVIPALLGATTYVMLTVFGLPKATAALTAFTAGFVLRGLAIHYDWSLPQYRPRQREVTRSGAGAEEDPVGRPKEDS